MSTLRRTIIFSVLILLPAAPLYLLSSNSPSRSGTSPASFQYREDINRDGKVSIMDVLDLLLMYRSASGDPGADINQDGHCNISDVIDLLKRVTMDSCTPLTDVAGGWRVVGPGGGGSMFLPTVNPADPANVFVRCDMTGAYVTHDNAETWRMFNLRRGVYDFEFDPSSPGTVYAVSSGLYRSEDGGYAWNLILPDPSRIIAERMKGDHAEQRFETADETRGVRKVRVDPEDSDHIWISNAWIPPDIMVSNDRGRSWTTLAQELNGAVLAIFPGTWWDKAEEVVVITERGAYRISETTGQVTDLPLPQSSLIAAGGGKGERGVILYIFSGTVVTNLYSSSDLGASWQSLNTSPLNEFDIVTLAVCKEQPEVVYLSCNNYFNPDSDLRQFGVIKTADAGETWNWAYRADSARVISNNFTEGWLDREYGPIWREYAWSLGVAPGDPNICYAADWGATIRTLDGGAHWEQVYTNMQPDGSAISRGLDVINCYGVHFDPFDPQHIFVSYTDIGASHSFNSGQSWFHAIHGIPRQWINTCYWAVFDPEVEGRMWSAWGSAHDLPRNKMFRSGFEGKTGGVAVSHNSGRTWGASNSGLPPSMVCTHIVLDPNSPADSRTLYVCGFREGVYKSTDGGGSWQPTGAVPGTNQDYWRLALLPGGRLFLLVVRDYTYSPSGVTPGGLFRSDNGGASWQQVSLPEKVEFPNDLVYDPTNPNRLYLSCWPVYQPGGNYGGGGLLLSENGGVTWRQVFREDAHVYAAAIDPADPLKVYINTFDSAAFRSEDGGQTWSRIRGYNFKWGHRPVPDPHNPGMLYLTTFGGGLHYGPAAGAPAAVEDIVNLEEHWRWGN